MFTSKYRLLMIVCITLGLVVSACGSFAPPESCDVGGTADEAKFDQHFTRMELVNEATGQPGLAADRNRSTELTKVRRPT